MQTILILFIIVVISFIVIGIISYILQEKHKKEKARFEQYKREQQRKREEIERREQKNREAARRRRIEREKIEREDEFHQMLTSLKRYEIELTDEKHSRNQPIAIQGKNVTNATPLSKLKDFIAVDTETTGLKAVGNDIIQLSAIKFENFEPTEIFSTYIKPRIPIPEDASKINGITDEMVEDAPLFHQVIKSFNNFIGDLPLVAHNAPFDIKHLYANGLKSLANANETNSNKINKIVYDTLSLSKSIIDAESYKLQNICNTCGIFFDNAHNAESDCLATGLLFVKLVAERKGITIEELIDTVG